MFRAFIIGVACIGFSQVSAAQDVDAILEKIRNGDIIVMQNDREIVCGIGIRSIPRAEIALKKRAKTLNEKIAGNQILINELQAELDEILSMPARKSFPEAYLKVRNDRLLVAVENAETIKQLRAELKTALAEDQREAVRYKP